MESTINSDTDVEKDAKIAKRASQIKVLFLDVDGVMTNGLVTITDAGEEIKSFNVKDGFGLKQLMANGIDVILITGRKSRIVDKRAEELGIREVYQGVKDKESLCGRIVKEKGLKKVEIGCMGDDIPDLGMFVHAGTRMTVADAVEDVLKEADYITEKKGGNGAVREICEWILKCQGKWSDVVNRVTGK